MAKEKAELELSSWQWSFLVSSASEERDRRKAAWEKDVQKNRMRRSELIAGLVEMNEVVTKVTEAANRARGN